MCLVPVDARVEGTRDESPRESAWEANRSEAGVDLVLKETSLVFLRKLLLISMRTASLT